MVSQVTQVGAVSPRPSTIEAAVVAAQLAALTDGTVRYVNSGAQGNGNGRTPAGALRTIDAAINASAAGDTIIVLEGHAETVANATTIVPDVAGLTIIGMGRGARRPTITFSHADGNIPITAAGVSFKNFLFTTTGTIDVTAGITVTAVDVVLEDLEVRESATTSQIIDFIVAAATSARLRVSGLRYLGLAGDAGASAVSVTGAVDGIIVEDFNIDGTLSAAGIENVTGVCTNIVIRNGIIRNRHSTTDACVTLVATSTGWVNDVYGRTATNDADGFNNAFVGAAAQFFNVLVVNADNEGGGAPKTASAAA